MRYGYFDNEHREYVIDRVDLPASWTNYIGLKDLYGVFNHTAGGYVLYKSSEYHRITRFRPNGVPMDGPGHYIYLRDDESGDYWTVSWQPVGKPKEHYSCRHGLSYIKYHCQSEINVMFSRFTSFIEVGGRVGLGYRDTAQDAMMVPHSNPEKCRSRLIELLRALTTQGYGLHLFEPRWFEPQAPQTDFKSPTVIPTPDKSQIVHGLKDACADDALWLVSSIVQYVRETGEFGFVDQVVTYADGGEGTVYEHMKKILDFSARQVGINGICKGLRADWNDSIRIQKAKELLADPKLKIGEIGEMVGYADTAHFARTFKKLEGMSANEYRNTIR